MSCEARVPLDHPSRPIREIVATGAVVDLSVDFAKL
jgi:hypothetical protein